MTVPAASRMMSPARQGPLANRLGSDQAFFSRSASRLLVPRSACACQRPSGRCQTTCSRFPPSNAMLARFASPCPGSRAESPVASNATVVRSPPRGRYGLSDVPRPQARKILTRLLFEQNQPIARRVPCNLAAVPRQHIKPGHHPVVVGRLRRDFQPGARPGARRTNGSHMFT